MNQGIRTFTRVLDKEVKAWVRKKIRKYGPVVKQITREASVLLNLYLLDFFERNSTGNPNITENTYSLFHSGVHREGL